MVVAAIAINERGSKVEMTEAALAERAAEVTGLLAMQLGGAIKFGNSQAIDEIVTDVIAGAKPDAAGAYIVGASGEVLYSLTGETFDLATAEELAARAMETGERVTSESGLIAAFPAIFGEGSDVAGVVVTGWDDTNQLALLQAVQKRNLMLGAGVMLVGLLLSALFLRSQMSRPLVRLEETMSRVAQADYDLEVPFTGRGDEIGKMALRLDDFRVSLAEAKEAEVESAFKSAAFNGSSAPMMMVDEDLRIIFVNPSCEALLKSMGGDFGSSWPGLDPQKPLGADLASFVPLKSQTDKMKTVGHGAFPLSETVKVGEFLIEIAMNAAENDQGDMIGAVIQWSDKTRANHNAALLGALDENQLRIEFDASGKVVEINKKACELVAVSPDEAHSKTLVDLFAGTADEKMTASDMQTSILSGAAMFGQFRMKSGQPDEMKYVDGSFAAVLDLTGNVERAIFLGADVTENAIAIRTAETERLRVAQEQMNIVEALGVALKSLSGGDLTNEIAEKFPDDYEKLREDFNDAITSLREAVSAVVHNADSIRNETKEITSAADDLSRRTEKQAATLEETAAALDELTSSVRSAAEGADEASRISAEAQANAEQGGDIAKQAVLAMDGIKNSSQEISKITSVIDDIAFQTNLLALNAGVEAARAGEAGRGFAVVATEVRALAQRSSDAAREINGLISSSGEQVNQGVELVDKTGTALSAIVTSVSEISKRVAGIAASAREQSVGLNEINSAVNDLDHVTQQNAAMFEETTAASHALTAEADALAAAVSRFDLGEGRTPAATKPRTAASATSRNTVAATATHGNLALKPQGEAEAGWEEF
ncbi:methyl-accepting chemotaxis protein [Roseobacter weihaiensis]|uniref:methyl-accepting chemotaxis protein n=1 Tax=Roseobacter weihaiensis TaxID=2763262 RepID=UPI0038734BE4